MQVYVADYTADVQHLSCEQDGAYWRILRAMWRAGGALPNDPRKLANICGVSAARWAKISPDVMALLSVEDGLLTQKRLGVEIEKANRKSKKRSEAGKLGAEARALKNNETPQANAEPLLKHSPEPEPEVREEPPFHGSPVVVDFPGLDPPVKTPAKRGSRLPTDWTPTSTDTAYAAERGFTESEIARHAEDFRDYWTARPGLGGTKLDWAATWRTRIRELADRRGAGLAGRQNPRGGGSGAVGLGEIIARRRGFLDD